jgi:THAP domain
MPRPCVVEGCPFKYKPPVGGMIHCFPSDSILRHLWKSKTGCERIDLSTLGVCSHHFTPGQYRIPPGGEVQKRGQLVHYATPSINLPALVDGEKY